MKPYRPGDDSPTLEQVAELLVAELPERDRKTAINLLVNRILPIKLAGLASRGGGGGQEASTEVPALATFADKVATAYAALAEITGPVTVQRIHGDYHLGQVLRSQNGWVLLDFGDLAVHVFHEEDRMYYALERLWRDCPVIPLELPAAREA